VDVGGGDDNAERPDVRDGHGNTEKAKRSGSVSNELVDDSDPSIVETLRDHLMKTLGLKLDIGLLEGSGTPPEPTGLKNLSGKQTLAAGTNGATVTFDMIADAIALLEGVSVKRENMRIVAHPRNLAALRKAKASTAGSYLWQDVGSAEPGTVFGVPIYSTAQLSTTETQGSSSITNSIYVYDVKSLAFVDRRPFTFEVDRSRLFNSDQSEIRAKLRGDLISPTPTGVVRLTGVLA
jgi:HK97 family phage major capsid protein